jgi:hypothetical protein
MKKIMLVQGKVAIHEEKNGTCLEAKNGMELDEGGRYMVATAENSSVKIMVDGHVLSLNAHSVVFFGNKDDARRVFRHTESWGWNVRIFVGKVWARVAPNGPPKMEGGNAVVGVRG